MTEYLKVRWNHTYADEPVLLLSELDNDRYEIRKIEIFADGTMGYATIEASVHGTQLSEVPLPPKDEIAADPQFAIESVTAEEFDRLWNAVLNS